MAFTTTAAHVEEPVYKYFECDADFTGKFGYFVEFTSSTRVSLCEAVTDVVAGVIAEDPGTTAAGDLVKIQVSGVAKVSANAAISIGASVGPSTDSQAQTAVSTQFPCGMAVTAASAAGDIFSVRLGFGQTVVA